MDALVGARAQLALGGFVFRVHGEGVRLESPRSHGYVPFLGPPDERVEGRRVDVRVSRAAEWAPAGRLLFDTGSRWALWAQGDERELVFFEIEDGGARRPSCVLRFHPRGAEARLLCLPEPGPSLARPGCLRNPFHYPVDQLLVMYLLGARGVMIHAAGLDAGGRGVACAGVSGAGKTTFTRLAMQRLGWRPLTDERVIVAQDAAGGLRLHGTPWHGEGPWADNRALGLRALVFLEQGPVNEVHPLEASASLPRLLRTVSLPWFDPLYLDDGLQACERLVRDVPGLRLVFRAETQAADVLALALERLP